MKKLLASTSKKIAYVIAIVIIIIGLLVSLSPLFSPLLNKHRTDLEQWASSVLGVPITIHDIQLSWHRYQPELQLNGVTFLNKDSQDPILQIRNVGVLFSMIQSLWQRQLIPSGVVISGSHLTIHRAASGEISIQGFPVFGGYNQQPFAKETKITEMVAWLSAPARIILHDINIRYSDFTNQKQFLTLNNLSLTNDGDQHTILGQAILHQDISTEATVAIQWAGSPIDLSKIKARIYLYVSGVLLSQWIKSYSWNGWQVNDGILSAKVWATWNSGIVERIQVNFQSYGVDLYSQTDKTIHQVNRLSGHIGWKREGDNQIVAGEDILIDLPSHLWPVTSFYVALAPDQSKRLTPRSVKMSYLDLQDTQSFLFSSPPLLPKETHDILTQFKLTGELQDAALVFSGPWNDWNQVSLTSYFKELSFLPWRQLPGMRHLSGTIEWDGKQGDLSLQSNRLIMDYSTVFRKPITIDQLTGNLQWQKDEKNQWLITIPTMNVLNNDGTANIRATLTLPNKAPFSPTIDLTGHFAMQKADHIIRYLPMRMFDPELEAWLNQAFLGGEISSGNVELQGVLNEFPFDQGKGTFLISAKVNNLNLHYAPNWPRLHHVTGQITFSGRKMLATIDHALMKNILIKNARGDIPYLGEDQPQIINIALDNIQIDVAQVFQLIHASPLENTLGKLFSKMEMRGLIDLQLGFIIPLKHPEKAQVKGEVTIPDAQLKLPLWRLVLSHLRGNLSFTENTILAKNIQGQLLNQPVTINISTLPKVDDTTTIQAELATHLNISDLENWLNIPFSSVAQGATAITTTIYLSSKKPLEVKLRSNLLGVSLQLPDPYKKTAQETRDFTTEISVSDNQPLRTKLFYSNLLSTALIIERKNEKFKLLSANFRLGGGDPAWPESAGLYITGDFTRLDWDKIKQYFSQKDQANLSGLSLRRIDVTAKQLDLFGQQLTQAHLQAIPEQQAWKINMTSLEVIGDMLVPMKWNQEGVIDAQFKRLSLHSGRSPNNTKMDMKSLPALSLVAEDFRYDDMPFGEMVLKAVPDHHGFAIPILRITSPSLKLQAKGSWSYSNKTHFQGDATSKDVSELINSLGLDARNFVASNGKLTFDLNWSGTPYAPSLATMTGHANLDLGKGRIVEIGQSSEAKMGIGRMLSIFSLQSIPRRLMLDFSDLFQKGYSFDNVRGDFDLHQGNAYTTNLRFDGPIARVSINGRIGLEKKDYDFTLSVTPYVSSGIPVAAGYAGFLTGGPIGGAAALAVSTVLGPAVSKAATYYYVVKGPWDNPSWASVDASH
ncbi:MAG: TIGR02099 family protein [Gammaproteobacteria bacterium RIFCSPHIGHO2_12_FULL_37_34]|nr:MAG: TIGR02099 family protein [Gammaproteobacteria bacterium RIFCSPHIGHO2_12_FULL_37_34]